MIQKNPTLQETLLSHCNFVQWTVHVSNPGCRAVMPPTNRLRHGEALNSEINLRYKDRSCSDPPRQRCMHTLESLIG